MKYAGKYVTDYRNILVASALSGQNAMIISEPGWGKTEMAYQTARCMAGDKSTVLVELEPSTPPEVIRGAYDPAKLLNGERSLIVTGTPYDPDAKIVILDELWRANEVVFDALIHATQNKHINPIDAPIFWGTSNFVGKSDRTAALRDRFGIWYWMSGDLGTKDIVSAHLMNGSTEIDPEWGKGLPTRKECEEVWKMKPTTRALEAIQNTIDTLTQEAQKEGFLVNPRRITQWSYILFRISAYYGSADFTSVHENAQRVIRYAYPCADTDTAKKWSKVALSIIDAIGTAIEEYKAQMLEKFRAVKNLKSASERTAKIADMGVLMGNAETELKRIGGNDPRVFETLNTINLWFTSAVLGKEIEG